MSNLLLPITKRQAIFYACFLVLYEFLTYIANDMIMPGMIHVVRLFNAPESMVATSLTVYMLGGASLQVLLGPISDVYGRRPIMLLGATLFFIFTLFIASSQSMDQFLWARFFQGMGLCFIGVIGYATIQEIFDEMSAIRIIAIMANAAILAPLLGPVLGALVIHYTSWRYIFICIAICALIALWGLWRYMPEPIGHKVQSEEEPNARVFSLIQVLNNYISLLSNKVFCSATLALALVGIPCIAWIALAPLILIVEAKMTVIQYGLWQIPIFGATILGNWFLHRLTYKYKIKKIVFIGCSIMMIGVLANSVLPYFYSSNYLSLIPGIIIYFFTLSIVSAPLNRFCLFVTKVTKGTVSALISLSYMSIAAIGNEIANRLYAHHNNFNFALFCNVILVLFFLCAAITFWLHPEDISEEERQT